MSDIVFIRDLKIDTIIGVFDWERQVKQTLSFDLEMRHDIRPAAKSDNLEDALDYKAVAKRLIAFVEASNYQLVERLAEEMAQIILNEFGVSWVKLTLNKGGALRGAKGVGVIIERNAG